MSEQKQEQAIQALIEQWRANGAAIDSYHATMGIGWKKCADELESVLSSVVSPSREWREIGTCDQTTRPGDERRIILVYGPDFGVQRGYVIDYGDGTRHHAAEGYHGDWPITHWMPLPDPPALLDPGITAGEREK